MSECHDACGECELTVEQQSSSSSFYHLTKKLAYTASSDGSRPTADGHVEGSNGQCGGAARF